MKLQGIAKTYPVAIASAIGLLVFASLGFWRSSQANDLKEELAAREQESERLTNNVRNSAKLNSQLEQMGTLTESIKSRLSNPGDLATNQQYFYKFESDNKVKLTDLHQLPPPRTTKKLYSFYSTVPYSLRATGDYEHILKFIRAIESGPRFAVINVATLDVSASGKKDEDTNELSPLTLSLTLELLGTAP